MRILLYGGSFNPPHLGHIRSARTAAAALKPDKTYLIPASFPPHKPLPPGTPARQHRLAMTRLAAEDIPGCAVSTVELDREGPSYTSDTLREMRRQYPGAELVFLMGTDMLLSLETWHEPEVILSGASLAVFARETGREDEIRAQAAHLQEKYGAVIYLLEGQPVTVSSTQIRALLPRRKGREWLPDSVYSHIIRFRLYGARPDFDWLREKAYAYLKPKRVPHVQGTEAEARRLAARWGEGEADAAEAAIVHDITKKLTLPEQLQLCEKYDIMADERDIANDKLLHARTGAAFAAELFGIPEHIYQAVRWHTTGRPGMTRLEKIIYLADYIEPNRSGFSGLEELRRAAYEDLDAAMELGLRMSLADIRSRGEEPFADTAEAQAWFLERLKERGVGPVPWTAPEQETGER